MNTRGGLTHGKGLHSAAAIIGSIALTGCAVIAPFTPGIDPALTSGQWPDVTIPERPETKPGTDIQGAEEAAREYFEAYAGGLIGGGSGPLEKLSDDTCDQCRMVIGQIRAYDERGLHAAPESQWRFDHVKGFGPNSEGASHVVFLIASSPAHDVYDSSGRVSYGNEAITLHAIADVRLTADGWYVTDVEQREETGFWRIQKRFDLSDNKRPEPRGGS